MAEAAIGGLLRTCDRASIHVAEPFLARAEHIRSKFGVRVVSSNIDAVLGSSSASGGRPADLVVIAVKPSVVCDVAREIAATVAKTRPGVISIAAGIRAGDLRRWLATEVSVVRAMPNTPALISEGATGLSGLGTTPRDVEVANAFFGAVSKRTYWVEDERLLDVVTALSGMFFCIISRGAVAYVH